jgi:hypothetical protein
VHAEEALHWMAHPFGSACDATPLHTSCMKPKSPTQTKIMFPKVSFQIVS